MSEEIRIPGELLIQSNRTDATLVLRFEDKPEGVHYSMDPKSEDKYIPGQVELEWTYGGKIGYGVMFQGYYLRKFADDLARIDEGVDTQGALRNWDGDDVLRVVAGGPRRTDVRISVRLGDHLGADGEDWNGREAQAEYEFGLRITVNDFQVSREMVMQIVRQINEYIRVYGVLCDI